MTDDASARAMLDQMGQSLREAYYTDRDVDHRAHQLIVHPDDDTVDCPVCLAPVADAPWSIQRRYGPAGDFTTGLYKFGPSPTLCTLSCGHRIEIGSAAS